MGYDYVKIRSYNTPLTLFINIAASIKVFYSCLEEKLS